MPRHPPCALSIFSYFQFIAIVEDSISTLIYCAMQLSRCSHRDAPRPNGPGSRGTLQTGRCAGTADGTRDTLEPTPLGLPRKEVIQPHLPVRLPCYDFTPLTLHTFGASPLDGWAGDFGCRRLGWCDGRCVQGPGTYSPRRADPRLLATPASRRRVAACDPNWGRLSGIRSPSRVRSPLYRPM